jgi:hypothetical protein
MKGIKAMQFASYYYWQDEEEEINLNFEDEANFNAFWDSPNNVLLF